MDGPTPDQHRAPYGRAIFHHTPPPPTWRVVYDAAWPQLAASPPHPVSPANSHVVAPQPAPPYPTATLPWPPPALSVLHAPSSVPKDLCASARGPHHHPDPVHKHRQHQRTPASQSDPSDRTPTHPRKPSSAPQDAPPPIQVHEKARGRNGYHHQGI